VSAGLTHPPLVGRSLLENGFLTARCGRVANANPGRTRTVLPEA
jgi:hypothetical protein